MNTYLKIKQNLKYIHINIVFISTLDKQDP